MARDEIESAAEEIRIDLVPIHQLEHAWPLVREAISGIVERSRGAWTMHGIASALWQDIMQLWIVWDGGVKAVVGTSIEVEQSGRKTGSVVFCSGADPGRWVHLLGVIEDWARAEGCTRMKNVARKGWAKYLPEYKPTHVVLERDL